MPTADHVRQRIVHHLPGADVDVTDTTGTGDHFRAVVVSAAFAGQSRVDQHRMVYDAVRAELDDGSIHALSMKTSTPEQGART